MKKNKIETIIKRKIELLKKNEINLTESVFANSRPDLSKKRMIFSCNDGFIVLRRYSNDGINNFRVVNIDEDIRHFLKKFPYPTKVPPNKFVNLYEVLKGTLGIEMGFGSSIGIGQHTDGVNIGNGTIIDGFEILSREYASINNFEDTLEELYGFLDLLNDNKQLEDEVLNLLIEIEEKQDEVVNKQLQINEKKIHIDTLEKNIKALSLSNITISNETIIKESLNINLPFNLCLIGEVSSIAEIRKCLNEYFQKLDVDTLNWNVDFINNSKLKKSDVFKSLVKGQSKYNLIVTGQIHKHSGKGNTSANILTELKKEKYVDHIVGSSPKEMLTTQMIIEKLDSYFQN